MKTAFAIVAAATVALYLYNHQSPQAGVGKHETANGPQTTSKTVEAGISAPRSTSIVIAPMPKIGLKTGPNAQTDLKSGPNAQNTWNAQSTLKTGPNAQTDLKTGPNAQNAWNQVSTAPTALKTGPNAQTDLTMKRSW